MRRAFLLLALALALGGAAWPAGALAQGSAVDQAKTYFNAGAQAYEAGRYGVAVDFFDQAYKLAPRPAILFSTAQAEKKKYFAEHDPRDLKRAVDLYRQYLSQVTTGGRRADATDALGELEPLASRADMQTAAATPSNPPAVAATHLMLSSPAPKAAASLDGNAAAELPLSADVAPGKHHVHVTAEGYFDEDRDVDVEGTVGIDIALRERPALLSVTGLDGADVIVDGRLLGTTPLVRPLEVPAGKHLVAVMKNGYHGFSREVAFEHGQNTTVDAHAKPTGQRVVSYVLFGAGAAAVVAGAVFTGIAISEQSKASDINAARQSGPIGNQDLADYNSDVDARNNWRSAAVGTFAGAAALFATGAVLYFFDKPSASALPPGPEPAPAPQPAKPKDMELSAAPVIGPGFAGFGLGGRF